MNLVLANCGDAVATDIRVDFSRSLRGLDDASPVSDLPLFKRLGVLRPGVTLRVFWNAAAIITQREHAAPFIATVSWTEGNGATRRAEFRHDPSIFRHWPQCD